MSNIDQLLEIMSTLRGENGCPWDREQTFATIAPYTIEEAYEVADAIDRGDLEDLKGELGDLLLQVVFHSQMASEAGEFSFEDVVEVICEKMRRRHPHVFGDIDIDTSEQMKEIWEAEKARERARKRPNDNSVLADVTNNLPGLTRSVKLQKRAANVGFDWNHLSDVFRKLHEEINELSEAVESNNQDHIEDELGDILFVCTNLARKLKIDPEVAIRRANQKFERRFTGIEKRLEEMGTPIESAGLELMDQLWNEVKQIQRAEPSG